MFLHFLEGYGREFRERLLGQWGVVDVNDCCSCAAFLVWLVRTDKPNLLNFVAAVLSIYSGY